MDGGGLVQRRGAVELGVIGSGSIIVVAITLKLTRQPLGKFGKSLQIFGRGKIALCTTPQFVLGGQGEDQPIGIAAQLREALQILFHTRGIAHLEAIFQFHGNQALDQFGRVLAVGREETLQQRWFAALPGGFEAIDDLLYVRCGAAAEDRLRIYIRHHYFSGVISPHRSRRFPQRSSRVVPCLWCVSLPENGLLRRLHAAMHQLPADHVIHRVAHVFQVVWKASAAGPQRRGQRRPGLDNLGQVRIAGHPGAGFHFAGHRRGHHGRWDLS